MPPMPRASARILLLLALVLAGLTLAVALWPRGGQQADVMPMVAVTTEAELFGN